LLTLGVPMVVVAIAAMIWVRRWRARHTPAVATTATRRLQPRR
jgi:hypothetical protein